MSENLFILTFLKSEIDSKRFGEKVWSGLKKFNSSESLIFEADLNDENQNYIRRQILDSYRKYSSREELFEDFPIDILWQEELWEMENLLKSLYINYSYWNELSNQTRKPIIAAQNILAGKEIFGVSNQHFLKFINQTQTINFANIILVKESQKSNKSVILEGHSRITIYALNQKIRPKQIQVLVGYSQNISNWGCF